MNDTTIGPVAAGGVAPSGNRWEPADGPAPVLPPETAHGWRGGADRRSSRRGRLAGGSAWIAGGAAAVVVSGLGGFWVGHATAPEGDGIPAYVHQDGQRGLHDDGDGFQGPGGFAPRDQQGRDPQDGQEAPQQQAPGTGEGSNT